MMALAYAPSFPPSPIELPVDGWHPKETWLFHELIEKSRLSAVFQPIIDFRNLSYIAFEGLIRGPKNSPLHTPKSLFAVADRLGARRSNAPAGRRYSEISPASIYLESCSSIPAQTVWKMRVFSTAGPTIWLAWG